MHIDTPGLGHARATPASGPDAIGAAPPGRHGSHPRHIGSTSPGRRAVALLALAAALVTGVGCTDPSVAGQSSTPDPATADTVMVDPASLPRPVPTIDAGTAGLGQLIDLLVVAPEADEDIYERELFGSGWIDADGDRCDTRAEVLIEESMSLAQVDAFGCGVVEGDWISVYDGVETTNPGDLDIDHVVALGEAWRSGASRWDEATRLAFANDLDHRDALIAVSASSNRSKGDRDPAEWKPPSEESWCGYVYVWTSVKVRWALTADQAEVDALRSMAEPCEPDDVFPTPFG